MRENVYRVIFKNGSSVLQKALIATMNEDSAYICCNLNSDCVYRIPNVKTLELVQANNNLEAEV